MLLALVPLLLVSTPAVSPAAASTCEPFATVDIAGRRLAVQNNKWNEAATGAQCLDVDHKTGAFTITSADNVVPTDGPPASYPSIFMGCHWGTCTTESGLPVRADRLQRATTSWSITAAEGQWNAAFDLWFHSSASTAGAPDGAELMIWIHHQGRPQPVGAKVGSLTTAGADWDVWVGRNGGWNVISYVRTPAATSVELDLLPFIADARERKQIHPAWWLITIEAGFEPWEGGAGLSSRSFQATFVEKPARGGKRTSESTAK
jgi:hypothetical protein